MVFPLAIQLKKVFQSKMESVPDLAVAGTGSSGQTKGKMKMTAYSALRVQQINISVTSVVTRQNTSISSSVISENTRENGPFSVSYVTQNLKTKDILGVTF